MYVLFNYIKCYLIYQMPLFEWSPRATEEEPLHVVLQTLTEEDNVGSGQGQPYGQQVLIHQCHLELHKMFGFRHWDKVLCNQIIYWSIFVNLNVTWQKIRFYQVILPAKNPVVDVQSAELLFVDAHQVISLSFDQPLLHVVPREGGQVIIAYMEGLQINGHFSHFEL